MLLDCESLDNHKVLDPLIHELLFLSLYELSYLFIDELVVMTCQYVSISRSRGDYIVVLYITIFGMKIDERMGMREYGLSLFRQFLCRVACFII